MIDLNTATAECAELADPVEVLFGVRLGGGTDINTAPIGLSRRSALRFGGR